MCFATPAIHFLNSLTHNKYKGCLQENRMSNPEAGGSLTQFIWGIHL